MKQLASIVVAGLLSLGLTTSANAAFINGGLSFGGEFSALPGEIVNSSSFFDVKSPTGPTQAGTGDFEDIPPATAIAADIDVNNTDGLVLYHVAGYSFTLGTFNFVGQTELTCSDFGICADTVEYSVTGIVSKAGLEDSLFAGSWTANGSCAGANGSCTDLASATASWSSSLTALGNPQPVPEPATLALLSLGMIGFGASRRRAKS